jgi:AraC-like DNA-binding protein
MAARSVGESWADVSYSCGFNDQAHMINDVGIILGDSPEKAISALGAQREDLQSELGQQPILVW